MITINILPNISGRKDSQIMKFGQVKEHSNREIFLLKNHSENESGKLVPDHFLFFKKVFGVKASGL